eukprot:TRINITY_DN20445_c0_g1_i2.p1 TRINITY_DN20445_c0_g1~~TRINITY_DN20445_c0_g1_i2.p1  ORF type:complete len:167 (+),score=20.32 TRINITY_DN20445_c0_g1_i2:451-951(+)
MLAVGGAAATSTLQSLPSWAKDRGQSFDAPMQKTSSGLQFADVKVGEGDPPTPGTMVTIDYVMATTGSRQGVDKLDATKEHDEPFRFKLGDPNIIAGLQEGVATMRAGGIRRIIVPEALGYTDTTKLPVPLAPDRFQRFRVIYQNPNRQRQPDMIFDIKLFSFNKS